MYYKIQSLLYRTDKLTPYNLLNELKNIIDVMPTWQEKGNDWLIAHPSKRMIAINKLGVTEEALFYVDCLINNNKSINIVLADENEDDSIITICYKNTPAVSSERYLLSITIKQLSNNNDVDSFIYVLDEMIKYDGWFFKYILLDTEQYRFNQREVFDDRLPVGWMLYLPVKITYADAPSAYKLFDVTNDVGTIIVSKDTFNGNDKDDIACANNVEIELASNGLLPLVKGM
ncbi:Imm52 family immunity protein [Yersinia massiliensis]|uniref:Imm52 family immunity protein n=1 Tax=Yersinia massiliensis TaxID=419257 RepID=UPI00119F3777|nr:Imm52 family immunity protein [Yersinia massiliensis]MCB5309801.1 immunity 52 family protein [Yersinia massiliensis]